MFCGKVANNDLNRTHKRGLRILLNDYTSTFNELLHRVNECIIHQKNLQKLMLEVYNSLNTTKSFVLVGYVPRKGPGGVTSICRWISCEFPKSLRKGIIEPSILGHRFLKIGLFFHGKTENSKIRVTIYDDEYRTF